MKVTAECAAMRRIGICKRDDCPLSKPKNGVVDTSQCRAIAKLKFAMTLIFDHTGFKTGQLEAMLPVAHGRDVFVRMPTGGGKTLCMLVPPLATSDTAIGLIISPLVSLIDQQVSTRCMKLQNNYCVYL